MPNTRLGLWKSIKRRGKDVVSTASAASTVEESISCGTFGSTSKRTLQGGYHRLGNGDLQESRPEVIDKPSADKLTSPVEEVFIRTDRRLVPDAPAKEESYEDAVPEGDQRHLSARQRYNGPVDVDDYIQDDTSTSTTSEERQEILAIKRRLQSRHASQVPRQIILFDIVDDETSLDGYEEDGCATLFDDVYRTSYPFDEPIVNEHTGSRLNKNPSRARSRDVNSRSSDLPPRVAHLTEKQRAFEHTSSRATAPNVFEC